MTDLIQSVTGKATKELREKTKKREKERHAELVKKQILC